MLYDERERKIRKNANLDHVFYLLAKFIYNIFDEAFQLTSVFILFIEARHTVSFYTGGRRVKMILYVFLYQSHTCQTAAH